MDIYAVNQLSDLLSSNTYPGRGIVIGKTADGKKAAVAYFIMGRSVNSRNRVFVEVGEDMKTEAFDPSKMEDPSLIIYYPVRKLDNHLIVTNGDQTDTIYNGLKEGKTFSAALETREFEPDGPNWTPRISGMLDFADGDFTYQMSILKSADAEGTACNRFTYSYAPKSGLGHFIHTYVCDGNPIPTFQGEPERVAIPNCIDEFTEMIWNNLNENNKISLYVRFVDLADGTVENRMINKHLQ
ncbi:MAG: IMP cyclohydrolase [Lachnospiraceae bacterium]|nr:IMP cyclohydrolase [Lachnospiraceae bacterium]